MSAGAVCMTVGQLLGRGRADVAVAALRRGGLEAEHHQGGVDRRLAPGLRADVLRFRMVADTPIVRGLWVAGRQVM